MWETWVQPLGWEDPLEKGKATHSSILAWRIPWTEEIGELQSVGPQRVRHNWVTNIHTNHRGESLTMTPWLQGWSLCALETTCVSNPMSLGISIYLSIHTEKAMAPHSSTLTWKIPWTEKPVGLQSMGSLRVGHDWVTSLSRIGEGNGNPLQCSCLENPRDWEARWAAVYGVAQSQTRLKWLSSSSIYT